MRIFFENEVNLTLARRRRRWTTAPELWTSSCSSSFFPENEERDGSVLVERESIGKRKLGNGLLIGFRGIYTFIILCKPTHPFTVRSLFLNPLIFLSFWSNGSWTFHLTHVFIFHSNPRDQDHMAVMVSAVIKSEPSDLSDDSDLSSLCFYYIFIIYTTFLPFVLFFYSNFFSKNS